MQSKLEAVLRLKEPKIFRTMLIAPVLIALSCSAMAATTQKALSVTGSIFSEPPPANCIIIAAPSFSFNVQSGAGQYASNIENAVLQCTKGLPFQIGTESTWSTFNVGSNGGRIGIALLNPVSGDANLASAPINAVGTSLEQRIGIRAKLGGQAPGTNLDPKTDHGAFTGTVNLLLLY
jgi:hypothetical protein